jgi:hypothetical protein
MHEVSHVGAVEMWNRELLRLVARSTLHDHETNGETNEELFAG